MPRPASTRLRLRITAASEAAVRRGHPWVFADSVREPSRVGQLGELAVLYDRQNRFLAIGLFDPDSPLRVRILHSGKPATIDDAWWAARLKSATQRRAGLFDENTTGFRWIHGESDGWPALVLDRYDTTLVLKLYSAVWLPRLSEVLRLIATQLTPARVVLRLSRNIQEQADRDFGRRDGTVVHGEPLEGPVVFRETGLRFEADALRGQKTGFFLDQRENRRRVESLARGRDVLNAFSYSGGFSLYAARGGAKSVTDLDLSAHALAAARRNFALNSETPAVAACRHDCVQADAFDWLNRSPTRHYGLVILDPPSLARRESERSGALGAYANLVAASLRHVGHGDVLLAASCSAHVSADEFFGAVREKAKVSGRPFQVIETTRQPPDHPATFPEAEYLKAIYLQL